MGKYVIRLEYRGQLKEGITRDSLVAAADLGIRQAVDEGWLLTGTLCGYGRMVFLYLEMLVEQPREQFFQGRKQWELEQIPEKLIGRRDELEKWPEAAETLGSVARSGHASMGQGRDWVYMTPVFWVSDPGEVETWKREPAPDRRCGRIAILKPDLAMGYIYHHQALVREGLLMGDKYQFISVHENLLFSYFEMPRDRGRCNRSGSSEPSKAIEAWMEAVPEAHFDRFPEDPKENFHVIETLAGY